MIALPRRRARTTLREALDWIEEVSVLRARVDWPALRAEGQLFARERSAHAAIRFVLERLGDRHAMLIEPDAVGEFRSRTVPSTVPRAHLLEPNIGYLELPRVEKPDAHEYANAGHRALAAADGAAIGGWIVDLRGNRGGDVYGMLAAVGPLTGDGHIGGLVDARGRAEPWRYCDGAVFLGDDEQARVDLPHSPGNPRVAVAVLTSPDTASAGEAVAVAFRARPRARSFGRPTAGVPTGLEDRTLADGCLLRISTSLYVDRAGRAYSSRLVPDELVPSGGVDGAGEADQVVAAARRWLRAEVGR